MIITKTPYRISFFGGGSDYPVFCHQYGGQILSTAIDKYCYLSVRELPPFFPHKHRLVYSKIESVLSASDLSHPVVREMLLDLNVDKMGWEIHHDGDLPARAGLGSSSTFTVGLYNALSNLAGSSRSKNELADYAIRFEQSILKESVGYQDQIAAAFGGFNKITFHKGGGYDVTPVQISRRRRYELESHLLLVFTGVTRFASKIAEEQISSSHTNTDKLKKMVQMVDDAMSILGSENENIADFGFLLDDAWKYKKSLTDKISSNSLDEIYETAKGAGAIGGKLLGAGGGGFFLFFAAPYLHDQIIHALGNLVHGPFKFSDFGSTVIFNSTQ